MKKMTFLLLLAGSLVTATSCVKDWKCDCTDGTTTTTVEIYPDSKFLDAKKTCDKRQSDLKTLNSSITCKVK